MQDLSSVHHHCQGVSKIDDKGKRGDSSRMPHKRTPITEKPGKQNAQGKQQRHLVTKKKPQSKERAPLLTTALNNLSTNPLRHMPCIDTRLCLTPTQRSLPKPMSQCGTPADILCAAIATHAYRRAEAAPSCGGTQYCGPSGQKYRRTGKERQQLVKRRVVNTGKYGLLPNALGPKPVPPSIRDLL